MGRGSVAEASTTSDLERCLAEHPPPPRPSQIRRVAVKGTGLEVVLSENLRAFRRARVVLMVSGGASLAVGMGLPLAVAARLPFFGLAAVVAVVLLVTAKVNARCPLARFAISPESLTVVELTPGGCNTAKLPRGR